MPIAVFTCTLACSVKDDQLLVIYQAKWRNFALLVANPGRRFNLMIEIYRISIYNMK